MQVVQLDHLNLSVKNYKESVEWYRKAFGFEVVEQSVTEDGHPWGVIRSGNSMLCIFEEPHEKHPDSVDEIDAHRIYHFALSLQDVEAWKQVLDRERFETFYDSPIRYPHSTSWYVKDPTGYMIEVVKWDEGRVSFNHAK